VHVAIPRWPAVVSAGSVASTGRGFPSGSTAWDLVRDNTYLIGEHARPERLQRVLDHVNFTFGTDDRIALFPETTRVIRTVADPAIAHRISTGRPNDPAVRIVLSDSFEWVGAERWLLVNGAYELLKRRYATAS
jgi:hypothetical protein